jgi:hypothetical protein
MVGRAKMIRRRVLSHRMIVRAAEIAGQTCQSLGVRLKEIDGEPITCIC